MSQVVAVTEGRRGSKFLNELLERLSYLLKLFEIVCPGPGYSRVGIHEKVYEIFFDR
jgi:hypothetical protein